MSTAHIRHGIGAVRPYVYAHSETIVLIMHAFGAVELEREENKAGGAHIEFQVGDSVVVLETGANLPPSATTSSVYVYVEDVDAAYAAAIAAGATSIAVPEDKPYEERAAGVRDSFGNVWYFATYKPGKE